MKNIVVIDEHKQALLDRLLGNGVKLSEISRLIGVQYDTLAEKLKRRKRGDPNWHNRMKVDHRGANEKTYSQQDDERDDMRIRLFDLTKMEDGVTVQQAVRMSGYSEMICRRELEDFCRRPTRSDVDAICHKIGDRYMVIGRKELFPSQEPGIKIIQVIRGRN